MKPILFDTSVYITALRRGSDAILALRRSEPAATLWLSSVVLEELYAGAGQRERTAIQRLERDFDRARRILVPNLGDWAQTGMALARLAAKYGYEPIGRGRITNDALIALSTARLGIKVITSNARDFGRLAEFCSFTWSVL